MKLQRLFSIIRGYLLSRLRFDWISGFSRWLGGATSLSRLLYTCSLSQGASAGIPNDKLFWQLRARTSSTCCSLQSFLLKDRLRSCEAVQTVTALCHQKERDHFTSSYWPRLAVHLCHGINPISLFSSCRVSVNKRVTSFWAYYSIWSLRYR